MAYTFPETPDATLVHEGILPSSFSNAAFCAPNSAILSTVCISPTTPVVSGTNLGSRDSTSSIVVDPNGVRRRGMGVGEGNSTIAPHRRRPRKCFRGRFFVHLRLFRCMRRWKAFQTRTERPAVCYTGAHDQC